MPSASAFGNVAIINNRAHLRSSTAAGLPPCIFMLGTTTPLDGGQGFYAVNLTDKSTADNGTSVIVDGAGYRWELVSEDTGSQIMAALVASGDVTAAVATWLASPSSANLRAAVSDETGTGALVFANSPALVTPDLGTPSAAVLTNATGLPVSSGIAGLGANVATFLATPSSANLRGALTDETGTGAAVFATSPALVTPDLGTPSAATLTNATGLPISTGVSGLAAGVATFLATPSSANLAAALTDEVGTAGNVPFQSTGTFTPVLTFATPGDLSVTYSIQVGTYVRTGNQVTVNIAITTSAFTHTTASGNLNITGLPFTARVLSNELHISACIFAGITKATYTNFAGQVQNNTSILNIIASGTGVAQSAVAAADMPTGGSVVIRTTLSYIV